MREIKFRAWDSDLTVIFYSDELQYSELINKKFSDTEKKIGALANFFDSHYDCDIMQFTGLKDKNQKDAYRDDLCKLADHTDIYQIKWNDGFAGFYFYGINSDQKRSMNRDFEIIGNIHENPELKI